MFKKVFSKLLDTNQKELDRLEKIVVEINALEKKVQKLKKADFKKESEKLRNRLSKGESFDKLIPLAFALAREASWRAIGLKHYDVQLSASIALFEGKVVEQKTGEGKTLSAVPALYLRALTGKGVHLVTVNDYLARRDAGWNAPIFEMLGQTVGAIVQEQNSFIYDPKHNDTSHGDERLAHLKPTTRNEVYRADITYGTNNEFGFDYLRDNMVQHLSQMVQRGHYYAIVDEVDSVLIDEARTPLIISAPDTDPTDKYYKFFNLIKDLKESDFTIDEKAKSASLTERGIARVEKILNVDNLYEKDFEAIHHIENALRARTLYLKDREYVVKDDAVTIVDEFTGRLMFGRRWSDGLHQAVEAKEGVNIQQESKTLATISFQNYFRMYEHLSGMTGTAATEAEEFRKIYELEVVVVPTNKPMARKDYPDSIYKTLRAKYEAIAVEVAQKHKDGQPVLVGTTSIEKNEVISTLLKKKRIPHNVLNAKNHEGEAVIISQAGKVGAVTVATNMAGRGVDIVLGGAPPEKKGNEYKKWETSHKRVIKAGGLHVIGTERHESRRIDNQLRGRSGRQGDAGSSRFYLSLEDDLMRIFGGDKIANLMNTLKIPEDQPIENNLISKAIEQSQVKVEGFHFDARKQVVEYDDIANQQREIVYGLRKRILEGKNLTDEVLEKLEHQVDKILLYSIDPQSNKVDHEKIIVGLMDMVPFDETSREKVKTQIKKIKDEEKLKKILYKVLEDVHKAREKQVGDTVMRQVEKYAYLGSIDHLWIDHIDQIDGLREGVRLRAYGQRDPIVEFKNEAYTLFEGLMDRVDEELAHRLYRIGIGQPKPEVDLSKVETNVDESDSTGLADPATKSLSNRATASKKPVKNADKIGRNDPCPCGAINPNTKKPYKYKKCGLINAPHHKG